VQCSSAQAGQGVWGSCLDGEEGCEGDAGEAHEDPEHALQEVLGGAVQGQAARTWPAAKTYCTPCTVAVSAHSPRVPVTAPIPREKSSEGTLLHLWPRNVLSTTGWRGLVCPPQPAG
jgi:hypothetical protein